MSRWSSASLQPQVAAGWDCLRSAGHIPGVAATDYAFYNFCGSSTQLYPFSPPQVESSAIEALGDLGFRIPEPPSHLPDGPSIIHANAPDGRPAKIKISPQNSLTSVRVEIGPIHIGDEELSRDLFRRISANFGTGSRVYTPIDPTLPKRLNLSTGFVPQAEHTPPWNSKAKACGPTKIATRPQQTKSSIPGQESATRFKHPRPHAGLDAGGWRDSGVRTFLACRTLCLPTLTCRSRCLPTTKMVRKSQYRISGTSHAWVLSKPTTTDRAPCRPMLDHASEGVLALESRLLLNASSLTS